MKRFIALVILAFSAASLFAKAESDSTQWKNLDDKHYLSGPAQMSALDLEGMVVVVMRYRASELKSSMNKLFTEVVNLRKSYPEARYNTVCSIIGEKKDVEDFPHTIKKAKTNNSELVSYWDLELAEGDPGKEKSPFFFVVDHKGKVVASGENVSKIRGAISKAVKAMGEVNPFFGAAPITQEKLLSVTNMVEEGKSTMGAYGFLRKHAAGKGEEAAEAAALIDELDRTASFRAMRLLRMLKEAPGASSIELKAIEKMWPKMKSDPRLTYVSAKLDKIPETGKIARLVAELKELEGIDYAEAKPSEKKAAVAKAKALRSRAEKLKEAKSYAVGIEAGRLSDSATSILSKLGEE